MADTNFSSIDATTIKIGGTAITATAAELNALSAGGLDTTELGILDGATVTTDELNNACDVSARVEELTASATCTVGIQSLELNHASVTIAAVIADSSANQGIFIVKQTDAGTASHTLTLTAGTFNGTNNVATLNAQNEALVVYFDSAGNGTVLSNIGSVALS